MRRIGAYALIGLLAGAVFAPAPSAAFGLSVGPFHFGLPLPRLPNRFLRRGVVLHVPASRRAGIGNRRRVRGAEPGAANLAVFYPSLALAGVDDDIFVPDSSSSWPFGYDAIFRSAFAKALAAPAPRGCRQDDRSGAIVARLRSEIRPTPAQQQSLEKLAGALGMASGMLAKACPKAIPQQPAARLRLMQWQIEALSMAISAIRPPLQQFEQSLDAQQRTRFASAPSASAHAAACGVAPTATDWSIDAIDQTVRPGTGQRSAIADLHTAAAGAASDLDAHCPKKLPADPLARLDAIQARLDASWRAMLAMQVALADLENRLRPGQRNQLAALNVVEMHNTR